MKTNEEKIKYHEGQMAIFAKIKNFIEVKRHLEIIKELRRDNIRLYWEGLTKPFVLDTDIPELPNPLTDYYINRLIELGAIPKDKMEDGVWYYGDTRNASLCKWDAEKQECGHWRYKFGYYWDTVNHFQDDDRMTLFVPIRKATEEEIKEQEDKNK